MNTIANTIKKAAYSVVALSFFMSTQSVNAQELVPDQNPNYKKSMDKYMANKDELLKNQGKTIQDTYKAIDDMQIRQDRKDQRRAWRQERRIARINNRGSYYRGGYSSPYYGGYNNPYSYNNGYSNGYNSGYGYSPSYYGSSAPYSGLTTIASAALLGLGLYWWLK